MSGQPVWPADLRLDGRVALVTGAGRNLGRAVALKFAEAGARVMVGVRDDVDASKAVVDEIEALGTMGAMSAGDISDRGYGFALVDETVRALGPVDILVHAAAIRPHNLFLDISESDWGQVLAVNCSSVFHLAQAVLPSMVERRFGRIIALGGTSPGNAGLMHSHISVSKAGLAALVIEIALEFGRSGITANIVSPGPMNTTRRSNKKPITAEALEKFAIPRMGEPSEVAHACCFLASNAAAFITGQTIGVNGGLQFS